MPADYEALLSLPGIGSYTAGAVASIAYGIPVPAVDGNVLRVLSRLTLCEEDILKQSVKKRWEQSLLAVMPREAPGDLNQALMELGATVCVPNGMAKCEECPISGLCLARKEDRVLEFPKKTPKKARRIEKRTVFLIRDGDAAAIRRRPKSGLLAGLYELPNVSGHLSMEEALEKAKEMDLSPLRIQPIGEAKHIFSHVEWHMIGYQIRVEHLTEKGRTDMIFVEPEETEERYPIPAAFGAYIRFLQIRLGQEKYEEK
jgi:A/G-specific adenine glycosylase